MLSVAFIAIGFLAGWAARPAVSKANPDEGGGYQIHLRWPHKRHATRVKAPSPGATPYGMKPQPNNWDTKKDDPHWEEKLQDEFAAMPVADFAHELALMLRSLEYTPEFLERKAAMLRYMDSEHAIATYLEYKKMCGMPLERWDSNVMSLITRAAMLDGQSCVEKLLKDGTLNVGEIGPLMHGWAKGNPAAAIAWYNGEHPDEFNLRDASHGLFFGLAEGNPDFAMQAYRTLMEDQVDETCIRTAGLGLLSSLMTSSSVETAARFANELPDELKLQILEGNTWCYDRQPVNEVVPWLAEYATDSFPLRHVVSNQLGQWARTDPSAALDWASQYASGANGSDVANGFFANVANNLDAATLQTWIQTHPDHPAINYGKAALQAKESQ